MRALFLASIILVLASVVPLASGDSPATTGELFSIETSMPTGESTESRCIHLCTEETGCTPCVPTTAHGPVVSETPVTSGSEMSILPISTSETSMTPSLITTPPGTDVASPSTAPSITASPVPGATSRTGEGNSKGVLTELAVFAVMVGFAWSLL